MTNEKLSYILRNVRLSSCEYLRDNIYYIRTTVKEMVFDPNTQTERPHYCECEFLIIADNGIKKAIIYNCANIDLHWYTFKIWRDQGVLSRALRTGIIKDIWPQIKSVTCCYSWDDDREEKYHMTKHLASLAELDMNEGKSCWFNM